MTFYTYIWLREDGTPYYIGKGKGRRAFEQDHKRFPPPRDKQRIIIQEWPSEPDAFEAEKFLIAYYGRKDKGAGPLRNLTDGGIGGDNPALHTEAHRLAQSRRMSGRIITWGSKISNAKRGCKRPDNIERNRKRMAAMTPEARTDLAKRARAAWKV